MYMKEYERKHNRLFQDVDSLGAVTAAGAGKDVGGMRNEQAAPLSQAIARLQKALAFCESRGVTSGEACPFQEALMVLEDLRSVREGAQESPSAAATTGGQKEI